jgi:hypothetical protein
LAPDKALDGTPLTAAERMKIARDCTLAAALIRGADKTRSGSLITSLDNQFSNGKDEYPTDLTTTYGVLVSYKTPLDAAPSQTSTRPARTNPYGTDANSIATQSTVATADSSGMTFAQRSTPTAGTNGVLHKGVSCYRCNNTRHYACDCPNDSSTTTSLGTTLLQNGLVLAHGDTTIDPSWVLLDSQSTISVFRNCGMLTNIRPSTRVLRAVTNGGFQDSKLVGDFPNLGEVWFNPESIANIVLLSKVSKICRVTMDTTAEAAMIVHRLDGSQMKFHEHYCGLYVFSPSHKSNNPQVVDYTMLSTVKEQKSMFTARDVARADDARRLYRLIGRPSPAEFVNAPSLPPMLSAPRRSMAPMLLLSKGKRHVATNPHASTILNPSLFQLT